MNECENDLEDDDSDEEMQPDFPEELTALIGDYLHTECPKDGHNDAAYERRLRAAIVFVGHELGSLDAEAALAGIPATERAKLREEGVGGGKRATLQEHDEECPSRSCPHAAVLRREVAAN